MAKFCLKKGSKRVSARKRYKIEKKVREHNRKVKKEAKKNPKNRKKNKTVQVPNQCPFKEDILKEVEILKKQREEEKQKQRDAAREKKRQHTSKNLEGLVAKAETDQNEHEFHSASSSRNEVAKPAQREESSLKAYYKEFKKVLDAADVILEVVDARDPLGTRCKQVEEAVQTAKGTKRLVLVLNKADLVPRQNLDQWLKYLRRSLPAVAFKSSTQDQSKRLGSKKLGKKSEDMIQGGVCFGAELLLSLLANYCRNAGSVKTSIRVGVVGLPNVGKSSVINSLKRSRACQVGNTPGITKNVQEVQLDSKIKLLDSPGIVFANPQHSDSGDDFSIALKNAVRIEALQDPFTPATAILKRVTKTHMMELYDMHEYSTPDEFFAMKAARMGRFKKGGIPDTKAAARSVLADWNSGKIRYYTIPPEDASSHLSAEIVQQFAKEFDIDSFAAEEAMMLDDVEKTTEDAKNESILLNSTGSVDAAMEIEIVEKKVDKKVAIATPSIKKKSKSIDGTKPIKIEPRKKKLETIFEIEGNQKLNKLNKLQFKKQKKERTRREKEATGLAGQLGDIEINTTDDYDFATDFKSS